MQRNAMMKSKAMRVAEGQENAARGYAPPLEMLEGGNGQDVAVLAYQLWQARGCPVGTPEEDWLRAEEQLRVRSTRL